MTTDAWEWVDHRVTDTEAEEHRVVLRPLAQEYLHGYEGGNEFLLSVQEQVYRLTDRQVRGVINCMRSDWGRGRDILERGPKPPKETRYVDPPWVHEVCPMVRHKQEHYPHYFPLRSEPGSSKHCLGWHALTRRGRTVRARFHQPFVRGAKSNLLHRSTHVGWVTWYPEEWHQYGPSYIREWEVGRACTANARPLKNPTTLTVEEAREAPVYSGPGVQHDALLLCPQCFPGTNYEAVTAPEKWL